MPRAKTKKNIPDADLLEAAEVTAAPGTAQQVHKIVTTFKKEVPIEEAEGLTESDEIDLEDSEEEEEEPLDPIQQMLADLNVSEHAHSWTMVVERLPNYEKDGRTDVMSKRVNCGTRPVTPDFIEDIRREFARPYKPNHFRITIKRNGKIFSHWPEALSLEPPPYDEIAAFEAKAAASTPPAITINNPGQPQSFKQVIDQIKQLADLRTALFPELTNQSQQTAQAAAPAQPLTTEAALLHLASQDESLIEKATSAISRIFRKAEGGAREIGFIDIVYSAIQNNTIPQIVREFRAMMVEGAALNGQHPQPQPSMPTAPGAGSAPVHTPPGAPAGLNNLQPISNQIPPHIELLNFAINACMRNAPITETADWIDSFHEIRPQVLPFIEAFLKMSPDEALQWLAMSVDGGERLAQAPHARQWIEALQKEIQQGEPDHETNGSH